MLLSQWTIRAAFSRLKRLCNCFQHRTRRCGQLLRTSSPPPALCARREQWHAYIFSSCFVELSQDAHRPRTVQPFLLTYGKLVSDQDCSRPRISRGLFTPQVSLATTTMQPHAHHPPSPTRRQSTRLTSASPVPGGTRPTRSLGSTTMARTFSQRLRSVLLSSPISGPASRPCEVLVAAGKTFSQTEHSVAPTVDPS